MFVCKTLNFPNNFFDKSFKIPYLVRSDCPDKK